MRKGWTETTLGDIAKCAGGTAFPHEFQGGDTGTPFVKVSDMNESGNERYLISSNNYVSKEAIKSLGARVWPIGTIVFAKVGAALLTEKRRILVKDTIFDNNIMGLVPKASIESHFLYLFMETVKLGDYVQPGAVPSVNNSIVSEIAIKLPPPSEQKRIVDVVSSVDSYIAALQKQADSARTARNAVLHELLSVGGDDWTETTLGKTLEIARGGSPRPIKDYITSEEDGINWVKIGDASASSKYIYRTEQKIRPEGVPRSRPVKIGDFILSNSMSFGRPYIMRTDGCIHDGWLLFSKVEKHFDEDFLYNLLMSDLVQKQFDSLAAGSGVRNLNIEVAKEVVIPLPPLKVQRRIAEIANGLDEFILAVEQALVSAKVLRSGLLSDLLSGEHEIPDSYDSLLGAA